MRIKCNFATFCHFFIDKIVGAHQIDHMNNVSTKYPFFINKVHIYYSFRLSHGIQGDKWIFEHLFSTKAYPRFIVQFWMNFDSRQRNATLTLVTWPWTWPCELVDDHVTLVTWPSLCLQPYIRTGCSCCKLYIKCFFDPFHLTLTLTLVTWPKIWSRDLDLWHMDLI